MGLTFRLRVSEENAKAASFTKPITLTLPTTSTSDTTLRALLEAMRGAIGPDATIRAVLVGYPPRVLEMGSEAALETSLQTLGVVNQEVIIVRVEVSGKKAARKETRKREPPIVSSSGTDAAAEEDRDGTYEEEESEEEEEERLKKSARKNSRKKSEKPVAATPRPAAKRPRKTIKDETELSEKLLTSHASGPDRSTDSVSAFFRRLTRSAVEKQYQVTQGNQRFSSLLGRSYHVLARNEASAEIQFPIGPRSVHVETIEMLSEETLRGILLQVFEASEKEAGQVDEEDLPREGLKPHVMAQISPRVFWNLVMLARDRNVEFVDCMKYLVPNPPGTTWEFVGNRARNLSEKGKRALELQPARRAKSGWRPTKEMEELGIRTRIELAAFETAGLTPTLQALQEEARAELEAEAMRERILLQDETRLEELAGLEIRNPSDVVGLRVPGRSEFVVSELKVEMETVLAWRARAEEVLKELPCLAGRRTRG